MTSEAIDAAPSSGKMALIREFMRLSGLQEKIDSAELLPKAGLADLQAICLKGGSRFGDILYQDFIAVPLSVVRQIYAHHRHAWQDGYERHLNSAYDEAELTALIAFFSSPVGRRLVDDEATIHLYMRTNTEEVVDRIYAEAKAVLVDPAAWRSAP